MSAFDPDFDHLPERLPLFPLPGVLLLPGGLLPLNVFEPRYLNMVTDALKRGRMLAMVQPRTNDDVENPPLYPVACAGRIVQFEETEDGRFLINLKGVCRLRIATEMATDCGYRMAEADWSEFRDDLIPAEDGRIDRQAVFHNLGPFLKHYGMRVEWDALKEADDAALVTWLSMVCPFPVAEKQALLEAPGLAERARVLTALIDMAVADMGPDGHMQQ